MRWHRVWDARDMEALLTLYHQNAVLYLPGGPNIPSGGVFRGKEGVRQAHEIAWSSCRTAEARLEDFSLMVCDDKVILQGVKGDCRWFCTGKVGRRAGGGRGGPAGRAAHFVEVAQQYAEILEADELEQEIAALERKLTGARAALQLHGIRTELERVVQEFPDTQAAKAATQMPSRPRRR